jgi:hypothetical protein
VVVDPLDRVSVRLELADRHGGKSIPPARSSPSASGCVPARRSRRGCRVLFDDLRGARGVGEWSA